MKRETETETDRQTEKGRETGRISHFNLNGKASQKQGRPRQNMHFILWSPRA